MERRKLTKEDIDKVRNIEGFPIGSEEDIIALSDPPYYTACPNPFIEEFIKEHGKPYDEATDDYHREPFAADVAEDKHDLIYNIHSYHTKVPPKAIKGLIEHYTKPGDIVVDSFCGTGMTGVAAQICDDYGLGCSQRKAILFDLSSIATFIAGCYNNPITLEDVSEIQEKIEHLIKVVGHLYETNHVQDGKVHIGYDGKPQKGIINYTVWSDIFICPNCSTEFVYYDVAVDKNNKTQKEFLCPHCALKLNKAKCERAVETIIDPITGNPMQITKSVPVLINYSVGKKRFIKRPDSCDIAIALNTTVDFSKLPNKQARFQKGDKTSEMFRGNVQYIWQVYRNRTLKAITEYLSFGGHSSKAIFLLTSALPKLTILNRYMPEHGSRALVGPMAGTFYLPAMSVENNVVHQLEFQLKKLLNLRFEKADSLVSLQSATDLRQVPANCVDYIFVDPPFGANIMYSELNILSESWLNIYTNNESEAIINTTQGKGLVEYQTLMTKSFAELYRILKPNRWITIEFHNSKNSVWNAIHEAISRVGFVIADVRTLSKEKKTINQFNAQGAVDQDLVISAYKPKDSFRREFEMNAGSEETAWAFVRQHLSNIPIVVIKNDKIEIIAERQAYLLFDRMVAYHIMQGIPVPLDATDFYRGLDEKFLKRDGMYFLPDQVNEYDTARIKTDVENIQFSLFVTNEKTAIAWLYQQLDESSGAPQTYAELQPKFMQEVKTIDKYEAIPELSVLLEENFLQDENGRWYVPDITKEGDVAKLREKNLWKEFEGYMASKGKLKLFRSEAIRVGFARLWKEKNYKAIVEFAERLPEKTIQEDANLLMYYDISLSRV